MSRSTRPGGFGSGLISAAIIAYVALIVYGSLFPFTDWEAPKASPFAFLTMGFDGRYSQSDLVVNLLAYLPLGFLLFVLLARMMPGWVAFLLATALGSGLSLTMESLQSYLPFRVSSVGDLIVNALSTLLGALIAWLLLVRSGPAAVLHRMREHWLRPGALVEAAFWAGCLAIFLTVGAIAPVLRETGSLSSEALAVSLAGVGVWAVAEYALQAFGVLALCALCVRTDRPLARFMVSLVVVAMAVKFVVAVLFLKMPPQQWSVSLTALIGLALALALLLLMMRHRGIALLLALLSLLTVFVFGQVLPWQPTDGIVRPMNPIAFGAGHMQGSTGILGASAWVMQFLVLGFLVSLVTPAAQRARVVTIGALFIGGLVFATEWLQQYLPGRYSDVTDVLLAVAGWCCAWLWPTQLRRAEHGQPVPGASKPTPGAWVWVLGAGALCSVLAVSAALVMSPSVLERPVRSSERASHPEPDALPPVSLPGFRHVHPRLPVPTAADIALLKSQGIAYLNDQRRAAAQGSGNLDAAINMAFIEPGSQNLDILFERLMAERFHFRANGTEIVAKGYDWLYHYWTESQREALRGRLVEGFDFAYRVIREQRLSPYNVIWYNSPFQRLLMLAIVLYGDDWQGEAAMRVAHHLLKNEMLPVWRQVMGRNGGWHEGGEYIGIGVGQAVWRVPAMWRNATGEDLFVSEPYLRGFLDFLIYRQRPDGTHFRWGDARHFDRMVPDQYALAIEYAHLPGLWPSPYPPRAHTPTSWPWGPLTPGVSQAEVAEARAGLPLARLFDGIGMVMARSDWTDGATYLSFRAGDNHWSHTQLDQGAFTIFKGGPLAIDSGLYGPAYGSDHHMNYSYQTVAHNTITVYDPADTIPMPLRNGNMRPIANDGGQRRIGSGWGMEPAPLNLDEWQRKQDIYHTGRIVHWHESDELAIAIADITPAYTNSMSGKGSFSHRTQRVERAWRIFAYDRIADVVVVYDDVQSSSPEFRKRWLLHTMEAPIVTESGFRSWISPGNGPGRGGGYLDGHVLYPLNAHVLSIGGKGFEFFVDGVNYDEKGEIAGIVARDPGQEVGAWRLELMPERESLDDQFLVVMFPRLAHETVDHTLTRLQDNGRIGVQMDGAGRSTKWWFTPGRLGVEVEVRGEDSRVMRLSLP